MRNIVLVSHGDFAKGVQSSLEMIAGKQENVYTVSLRPDGDDRQFKEDLLKKMKPLTGDIIIIADLLGGTPANVSLNCYGNNDNVEILTGLSLPLALECLMNGTKKMSELIKTAHDATVDLKANLKETEKSGQKEVQNTDLSQFKDYADKANIINTRIDERLIHGQVAGIWTTNLNIQRIIVANDSAAENPVQKSSMRMAAPSSMRLSVLSVKDAITNITSGKYGNQRLFLLFGNPTDAWRYIEGGGKLSQITVGNMSFKEGTREITKNIKVLPDEEKTFKQIINSGVKVTSQLVPNDPAVEFKDKLQ